MSHSRGLAYLLAFLVVSACSDGAAPLLEPGAPELASATAPHVIGGQAQYVCRAGVLTPRGWVERDVKVGIPRGAEHREGAVMVYRYRMYTTGGYLLRSADCEVPRTRTAFVHLSQELEVPTATWSTVLAGFDVGSDDEISGQGCVSDGFCEIKGITVTAPPADDGGCDPWLSLNWCQDDQCLMSLSGEISVQCGGGGPGGGDGGGGGGAGSSDDPNDYEIRSESDWDGTGDPFNCRDQPASEECTRIQKALKWLEDHGNNQCRVFGSTARAISESNNLFHFVSSRPNVYGGFRPASGLEGDRIGLTSRAFQTGELAHTIAHEAAHLHGWPDKWTEDQFGNRTWHAPGPDGRYADDWGAICRNPQN